MCKTDQDLAVEIEPRTNPNWGKITKSNIFLELKHESQRQSSTTEYKREKTES